MTQIQMATFDLEKAATIETKNLIFRAQKRCDKQPFWGAIGFFSVRRPPVASHVSTKEFEKRYHHLQCLRFHGHGLCQALDCSEAFELVGASHAAWNDMHLKFEMRTVQASSSWIFITFSYLNYLSYFGYSFIVQPILMQWLNPETEAT